MKIVNVPLRDIVVADRNPKQHRIPAIVESIERFGFVAPLLIDDRTGRLVAGHGRVEALRARQADGGAPPAGISVDRDGEWSVPAIRGVAFADDSEALAYLLADNRICEAGGWDQAQLREVMAEIEDRSGLGWDDREIDILLDRLQGAGGEESDDAITAAEAGARVSEPGDVWICGDHLVGCIDSLDQCALAALIGDREIAMVFTDPPYNVDYGANMSPGRQREGIANDNMSSPEYRKFCQGIASAIVAYCRGCVYVCGASGPEGRILFTALDEALHCSTVIIWNKDAFTLGRGKYQNQYEPVWFGWPDGGDGSSFTKSRKLSNVWDIPRPRASAEHPTMKPVELVQTALLHASRTGDTVLDLFGGSGSTLIAAARERRASILAEIDPKYADVIVRRWQNETGLDAVHRETRRTFEATEGA